MARCHEAKGGKPAARLFKPTKMGLGRVSHGYRRGGNHHLSHDTMQQPRQGEVYVCGTTSQSLHSSRHPHHPHMSTTPSALVPDSPPRFGSSHVRQQHLPNRGSKQKTQPSWGRGKGGRIPASPLTCMLLSHTYAAALFVRLTPTGGGDTEALRNLQPTKRQDSVARPAYLEGQVNVTRNWLADPCRCCCRRLTHQLQVCNHAKGFPRFLTVVLTPPPNQPQNNTHAHTQRQHLFPNASALSLDGNQLAYCGISPPAVTWISHLTLFALVTLLVPNCQPTPSPETPPFRESSRSTATG